MKKYLIIALLLCNIPILAQNKENYWEFETGYLSSNLNITRTTKKENHRITGVYAGFINDKQLKLKDFYLQRGIILDFEYIKDLPQKLFVIYLRIPLHVRYTYHISENTGLFISAGPTINIGGAGTYNSNNSVFGEDGLKLLNLQAALSAGMILNDRYSIKLSIHRGLTKGADIKRKNRINSLSIGVVCCL